MKEQTSPKKFSPEQRHEIILARLESEGTVRIAHLASEFGVAAETVRRDLDQLYRNGLLNRTYGGAAKRSLTEEPDIEERRRRHAVERGKIATYAASLMEADEAVMVDCGSTTLAFAHSLAASNPRLTMVTNCLPIASCAGHNGNRRVLLAPGVYSYHEQAVYGHDTVEFLRRFRVNRAVLGASGLTRDGVTDADSDAAWVKRVMIEQAEEVILLLDSSKFGCIQFETVCPLSSVDHLITDAAPGDTLGSALKSAGVVVHVVE